MTPVSTDTPKSAKNPTPEDTLRCVPVSSSASNPPIGAIATFAQNQRRPFRRPKHHVQNNENHQQRNRHHNRQPPLRSLLALILAGPIDVIADRQFHLLLHQPHGLFDRAAQVAPADAVFDCHVARILFAADLRSSIRHIDIRQLRQRHALSAWRHQPNILDRFFRIAIRRFVSRHQVIPLLALQHLAHRFAADRRLHRVLHIRNVDPVPRRLRAVHRNIQIRLPQHAKQSQILDAGDFAHHIHNLVALFFQRFQIIAI